MQAGPFVPAHIMKKYIVMWMSKSPESTYAQVAWATGINPRTIHEIIHDKRATVRFDTADAILLGLGYAESWKDDAELTYYYSVA